MLQHPIDPEYARYMVGVPVCAVMKDGSHYTGILSQVDNGKLVLNGDSGSRSQEQKSAGRSGKSSKSQSVAKSQSGVKSRKQSRKKAQTTKAAVSDAVPQESGFTLPPLPEPPSFSFGPKASLDLATVDLLFPIYL